MADNITFEVKFRRRRDKKTNYKKRFALLKSDLPRIVFRRSNKRVILQVIEFNRKGDKVLVDCNSNELNKFEWPLNKRNTPSAYLTGFLCGLKAKKKGLTEGVFDIGMRTPVLGSMPFAALKGLTDAGLKVPHDASSFPQNDRINGKHLSDFFSKVSVQDSRFSSYKKKNIDLSKMHEYFDKTKQLIVKELGE